MYKESVATRSVAGLKNTTLITLVVFAPSASCTRTVKLAVSAVGEFAVSLPSVARFTEAGLVPLIVQV